MWVDVPSVNTKSLRVSYSVVKLPVLVTTVTVSISVPDTPVYDVLVQLASCYTLYMYTAQEQVCAGISNEILYSYGAWRFECDHTHTHCHSTHTPSTSRPRTNTHQRNTMSEDDANTAKLARMLWSPGTPHAGPGHPPLSSEGMPPRQGMPPQQPSAVGEDDKEKRILEVKALHLSDSLRAINRQR
jgi:hypothetical protein